MTTSEVPAQPEGPERLQKILARAGVASRRVVEDMISDGRVTLNGEVATLGDRADAETAVIEVDGAVMSVKANMVVYLLNKPRGTVSTASDPQGRPTVVEIVPSEPRVVPVGRLDLDTEGLLLLTNDGDLTYRLTHPKFGVEKEYLAHVQGQPTAAAMRQLREGVELDDGMTSTAKASSQPGNIVRLTIHEGRNRQVRRMCEAVGHPVKRLVRTRIGPINDRKLKPGEWRELTQSEVLELQRSIGEAEARSPTESGNPNEPDRPPTR